MELEEFRALVKEVVEEGRTLAEAEARSLLAGLLDSPVEPLPEAWSLGWAALLATMARRGETAEELCGFAGAMRAAATTLPLTEAERARTVDTCGTGGDGLGTFNVSTAAGLIAAAAGAWVAKHGNRAVTSRCGSADVLEALGVPVALAPTQAAACLRETGFVFMLASLLHPAMRRIGPLRRALPFHTIFNLAGPLAHPAGATAQVVGVYAEDRVAPAAEALRLLGTQHSWVVHGRVTGAAHGLDELTVTGESLWVEVCDAEQHEGTLHPESLGLRVSTVAELAGGANAEENARLIEAILRGQDRGARRDIVLLNAGAALLVGGCVSSLSDGVGKAAEAIDSDAASRLLERLRAFRPLRG